eukprot:TRINITY_DN8828_c0_g2_i1.p1 TRINITY_DN8828_c0_g2~~TRINITY_DN8828_c0_g2_i1.p1  ORF type:complete len:368 (+),score=48.66 TRINITY_DN8828_c0_g2_i1:146-1249(+)
MNACAEIVQRQVPLLTVVITALLAAIKPELGAKGGVLHYEIAVPTCIVLVFLIIGVTTRVSKLRAGCKAIGFHIACQCYSLAFLPLAYYLMVYYWRWDRHSGILSEGFSVGVMAAMCMPTTAFTCVLFTIGAGGDESVAVVNAAMGNLIGTLVSPLMANLFIGVDVDVSPFEAAIKISWQLVVPLITGMITRVMLNKYKPAALRKLLNYTKLMFDTILAVVLYYIFCEGFNTDSGEINAKGITLMVCWVIAVHLLAFFGAWLISMKLPLKKRVAFTFVGSQKTEGMSIAIMSIIFPHSRHLGVLILPVVVYHSFQMAWSASITPTIRRYVAKIEGYEEVDFSTEDGSSSVCEIQSNGGSTHSQEGGV